MQKRLLRMLAAGLCLCLMAAAALADNTTIIDQQRQGDAFSVVTDVAVVKDTAYFRVYTHDGEEIWYWRAGMPAAGRYMAGLIRGSDYDTIAEAEKALGADKAKYAIVALFSDGERLMGLNHLNGLIFEISVQDGEPVFTDVTTSQEICMFYQDFDGDRWYWSPIDLAVSGDYLYWYSTGSVAGEKPNLRRITRISLLDGSCHDIDGQNVDAICAYQDGDLLIFRRQEASAYPDRSTLPAFPEEILVYDPETNMLTQAGTVASQSRIDSIAYDEKLDTVLYQDGTSIMGMKGLTEPLRYAYINTTAYGRLAVVGDQLIHSTVSSVIVRDLEENITAPETLQIEGASFDAAARSFSTKHTNVPLEYVKAAYSSKDYGKLFRTAAGEDAVDVASLSTATDDWAFQRLLEEDMLLDLSADAEIKAYVDALYPAFRDYVTGENGEIWAVPTKAYSYTGFFVNRSAMQTMGLTVEEMPTNMIELCEFVTRWENEFAEKYPNYACIEYTEDTRWYLLDMMVEMWAAHCQASGQEIRFDDPIFREALAALEKVETRKTDASMQTENPEVSEYKTGLFWMRCQLVSNWASYMEEFSDRIFIPFAFSDKTPFNVCVDNVQFWVVNKATESAEYAMKFVNEQIAAVNDKYAHVLLTTRTEPVESPYYAESLAFEQERLDALKVELEAAKGPMERVNIHAAIREQEWNINVDLQRSKYTVTPSAIENYVNVLEPVMYIHRENVLENTEEGASMIDKLVKRWAAGEITSEQFVREADMRLMMIEMTN